MTLGNWIGGTVLDFQALAEALGALLKGLPEQKLEHLSALFTQGTRLEVWFWDMAHRAEHWPDLREVT